MIKELQVLWYVKEEDFTNYPLDFKPYENHKIQGYEVCEVDEDLIYDLCDINPDYLEPIGLFKSKNEIENYLLENSSLESIDSEIAKTIDFTGEDYYISLGDGNLSSKENRILNWFDALSEVYNSSRTTWILWVTGYDVFDLAPTGKTLTYVLSDILNLKESYFDGIIPNKGRISPEEWNKILDKMYKKNHIDLGLKRVI